MPTEVHTESGLRKCVSAERSGRTRIAILTELISPYRIPVFNAAAALPDLDLHVIFFSETDLSLRQWPVYKDEIRFSHEVLPSFRWRNGNSQLLLNRGLRRALERVLPQMIVCGGYNYPASWQAKSWAKQGGIPFVLWSESTSLDKRSQGRLVEFLKKRFVSGCDAFFVPGLSAGQYLLKMGIDQSKIFRGANAVDSQFFRRQADAARQNEPGVRSEFDLPRRFFLYAGRLVREKGIFELLNAYQQIDSSVRDEVGLVFAGDGPARLELETCADSMSIRVRMLGFLQREAMASVYALADALVLPTHSDTWGLVVNEAMECGLPVLVSDVAGCAADLVEDGWNGFVLRAKQADRWKDAMTTIANDSLLRTRMGRNSELRIRDFTPAQWAAGLADLAKAVKP